MSNMKRRDFLKGSALLGLGGLVAPEMVAKGLGSTALSEKTAGLTPDRIKLQFRPDGKFKILQLTDTHYISGDDRSKPAIENVNYVLDAEKPDLVIHTGDVIFGNPAEQSLREMLSLISDRKIPYAVAFGNHDSDFEKSRAEMNEILMSLPYCLNTRAPGIYGETNCALKLYGSNGSSLSRIFYLFDSNAYQKLKNVSVEGYDYIHFDQIAWYRQQSEMFREHNGGKPVESLAFFHISLPEARYAFKDEAGGVVTVGIRGESVGSSEINSGLFVSMKEMDDVKAIFVGHDHNSDFVSYWNQMLFFYGRYSGGNTAYNDLKPNGARVIEITEGEPGFRSWIHLNGGGIEQNLKYPDSLTRK